MPQELLMIPLPIPPEAAVEPAQPKLFQSSFLPLDSPPPIFSPLFDQAVGQALNLNTAKLSNFSSFHSSVSQFAY